MPVKFEVVRDIKTLKNGDKVIIVNLESGDVTKNAEVDGVGTTIFNYRVEGSRLKTASMSSNVVLRDTTSRAPENWPPQENDVWSVKIISKHYYHMIAGKMHCSTAGEPVSPDVFAKRNFGGSNAVKLEYRKS